MTEPVFCAWCGMFVYSGEATSLGMMHARCADAAADPTQPANVDDDGTAPWELEP